MSGYKVIDLEFLRTVGMPGYVTHQPVFGFDITHPHSDTDTNVQGLRTSAWGSVTGNEHSGSHVDAFCHQAESGVMHGGHKVTPEVETRAGFTVNGAENLPIFFDRGILLDVPLMKGVNSLEPGYQVTVEDLHECCQIQDVEITEGCIVLVNLGNAQFWNDTEHYLNCPGVSAGASQMLADKKVKAVGADDFAWDDMGHFEEEMHCNARARDTRCPKRNIHI
ncbi:MAG: cyclase family protein [Thermodesulfobacteriota bacterium]